MSKHNFEPFVLYFPLENIYHLWLLVMVKSTNCFQMQITLDRKALVCINE